MKKTLFYFLLISGIISCKKDKQTEVAYGIVQQKTGCSSNSYQVFISNADTDKFSFICKTNQPPGSFSSLNCTNSIFVTNLPAELAVFGKQVKFSRYSDKGIASCLSSTLGTHEVEVYNMTAR